MRSRPCTEYREVEAGGEVVGGRWGEEGGREAGGVFA